MGTFYHSLGTSQDRHPFIAASALLVKISSSLQHAIKVQTHTILFANMCAQPMVGSTCPSEHKA